MIQRSGVVRLPNDMDFAGQRLPLDTGLGVPVFGYGIPVSTATLKKYATIRQWYNPEEAQTMDEEHAVHLMEGIGGYSDRYNHASVVNIYHSTCEHMLCFPLNYTALARRFTEEDERKAVRFIMQELGYTDEEARPRWWALTYY